MVKYGIVDGQRPKFYPDNFLRKYEMIMMVVKYSLYQQDQQIPQIVFSSRGWFADVAQNLSYAPYIAYADQQGWLEGLIQTKDQTKYFYPNKFLVKQTVCDFLQVACDDLENIESDITRAEFAHLLV
ncbi:TPA: hypothetical protein DEP21_01025 [Patescibacteria group bacterium]|nr:hypothetical protein [Candidatus Gracilibacteria bacterium]